jgi:hypothetical protein
MTCEARWRGHFVWQMSLPLARNSTADRPSRPPCPRDDASVNAGLGSMAVGYSVREEGGRMDFIDIFLFSPYFSILFKLLHWLYSFAALS